MIGRIAAAFLAALGGSSLIEAMWWADIHDAGHAAWCGLIGGACLVAAWWVCVGRGCRQCG